MTVRNPIHTELAEFVDSGSFIDPEDYVKDALYGGMGGNVGRIAIFRGEDTVGRLAFLGYQVFNHKDGWMQTNNHLVPVLKEEAYLPTETTGTAFKPIRLITETTPLCLSGHPLLDWLITEDLKQAELRLAELKRQSRSIKRTPFIQEEIKAAQELARFIRNLRV